MALENVECRRALAESYAVNERMNQIVLEHLDAAAWRARWAGGKGRTIADIVSHVHNVRRKWVRLSAPKLEVPAALDRFRCTQQEGRAALSESGARCAEMVTLAETFVRDGWARPWPAGPGMVAYMIAHDAHHRGQICMLAHQLGFPLPAKATQSMWSWELF